MKIWIDLSNSPHVNFFEYFINELKKEGHDVIITSRNNANTIDLIESKGWKHHEIGKHAGRNIIKKIINYPIRIFLLLSFLRKHKIDVAIAHSSFYMSLTAFLLRIPNIYINDNEHAKAIIIPLKFASKVYFPEALKKYASNGKWKNNAKINFYPGIKEGIYLWKKFINEHKKKITDVPHIYIRPEPWTAQYYKGKKYFLDVLINELSEKYKITILPRGPEQFHHYYEKTFNNNIIVPRKPLDLEYIYQNCDCFIGAGGTMTREIAVLGIPTISVYQDELLEVDKYLIQKGYMIHNPDPTIKLIDNLLYNQKIKHINKPILEKGKSAYYLIKKELLSL